MPHPKFWSSALKCYVTPKSGFSANYWPELILAAGTSLKQAKDASRLTKILSTGSKSTIIMESWRSQPTQQTGTAKTEPKKKDDDDWDSDPSFVNDVSEKNSRWGSKSNGVASKADKDEIVDIAELRKHITQSHDEKTSKEWIQKNGGDVKQSYGVKLDDKK
ncbi:hypothetical protein SmJEL517_g00671 [Synchytrium microbalum]|uniref:Uncharacterized protein n=1 Tax=Synchytrium microbalum TaxID=1806994 RepID=A0A507C924_9FUNG|nr:uncharacterized protein SmJEL517_g00671 [Synchytrium microbalum]TPX37567.1 hypothetical protein SmJEL517_g00671 [Synchytrium microbalum]